VSYQGSPVGDAKLYPRFRSTRTVSGYDAAGFTMRFGARGSISIARCVPSGSTLSR
jgi:hypothetical protein